MPKIYSDTTKKRILLGGNWIWNTNPVQIWSEHPEYPVRQKYDQGCYTNVSNSYPYYPYTTYSRGVAYVVWFPFGGAQFLGVPQYFIESNCGTPSCSTDSCRVDCATAPDGFCCIDHAVTNRLLQTLQG